MKKLILALATASGLAIAAPVLADHHGKTTGDAAAFAATHAEALSGAINHPTRAEDKVRDIHRHPAETLAFSRSRPT